MNEKSNKDEKMYKKAYKNVSMKLIIRSILIILIIINCVVIFRFSSEPSEKSNKTSGRIVDAIVENHPKIKNLSKQEKEKKKEELVVPIRKTAHFTVYLSLGACLYLYAKTFEGEDKKKIFISLMLAFLYACSDEIHQLFVSGRSGDFRDVCIDTCGACVGILVVYLVCKFVRKIK